MSSLLKCGGALVIEGVPVIVVGLASHQCYEAAIGGKNGDWGSAHTVRFSSGKERKQGHVYLPSHV